MELAVGGKLIAFCPHPSRLAKTNNMGRAGGKGGCFENLETDQAGEWAVFWAKIEPLR